MTIEEKAAAYDAIIASARWSHEFWLKAWTELERKDTSSAGYYEGRIHAAKELIRQYAEVQLECPCGPCAFQKDFNARERVAQNGEQP